MAEIRDAANRVSHKPLPVWERRGENIDANNILTRTSEKPSPISRGAGFHKILKKHDKNLPSHACKQFYINRMHNQAWVRGDYSDVVVRLSGVYAALRNDRSAEEKGDARQSFVRSTTKYWVRTEDVSRVKYAVLRHLPVFLQKTSTGESDSQLTNSVYFDNDQLGEYIPPPRAPRARLRPVFASRPLAPYARRVFVVPFFLVLIPPSTDAANRARPAPPRAVDPSELYHGRLDKTPGAIAYRLRWYGAGDPKTVFFEQKTHRDTWAGEASVKERFTVSDRRRWIGGGSRARPAARNRSFSPPL